MRYNTKHMINILASLAAILLLLLIAEVLYEHKKIKIEAARKLVHMGCGTLIAFWPWLMSWWTIRGMAVAFIAVILFSKKLRIFQSVHNHNIKRSSVGEFAYAVGIMITTFSVNSAWQFCMAILILAWADGLAAIVGSRFTHSARHRYRIFGHTKTWIGSATFFAVSIGVLTIFSHVAADGSGDGLGVLTVAGIALALTFIEALLPYGLDNIAVPLVAVVLTRIVI